MNEAANRSIVLCVCMVLQSITLFSVHGKGSLYYQNSLLLIDHIIFVFAHFHVVFVFAQIFMILVINMTSFKIHLNIYVLYTYE